MKKRNLFGLGLLTLTIFACKTSKTHSDETRFSTSSINTEFLDKSISPQEDFFLFSNGAWINENEIPNSESRWGSFNELDQDNKLKIEALLDSLTQLDSEIGSGNQIIGDYYTSFLNFKQRNTFGLQPILKEYSKILY